MGPKWGESKMKGVPARDFRGGVELWHPCALAGLRVPVVPCQDHHLGAAGLHCGRNDERAGRFVPAEVHSFAVTDFWVLISFPARHDK